MGEIFTTSWKRLFEVRLLHHYWLDDGATAFDAIADSDRRQSRLLEYDRRPFLAVRATPSTAAAIAGAGCLMKQTPTGFVVAAPADIVLPTATNWSFVVTVNDGAMADYTALGLRRQTVHEFLLADGFLFRCKENVPVLSNATGAKRTLNGAPVLFLSRPLPAADSSDMVESIFASQGSLRQLTSDNPNATSRELGTAASSAVYMHQGDIPALTVPSGVAGAPARGIALTDDVADDVFVLLQIQARRGSDNAFSFTEANGAPRPTAPVFDVRFKNRSIVRRYMNRITGAAISTEAEASPLTVFGNAGSQQKPSFGLVKPELSGAKVTRLVSEIYI